MWFSSGFKRKENLFFTVQIFLNKKNNVDTIWKMPKKVIPPASLNKAALCLVCGAFIESYFF